MATPKDMLELRLDHAATPERVARATRLLADMLRPLLGLNEADEPRDLDAGSPPAATVVVSNREMRATVRVWSATAEPCILALANFIQSPEAASDEIPPQVVDPLIRYTKAEASYSPSFWLVGETPRRLRIVDETLANEIDRATRQRKQRRARLLGAMFLTSRIYRVGRKKPDGPVKARVLLPNGSFREVEVATAAVDKVNAAYTRGHDHRVKLVGDWVKRDGCLELEYDAKVRIVDVDEQVARGDAMELLAATAASPPIAKHEIADFRRYMRRHEDDE